MTTNLKKSVQTLLALVATLGFLAACASTRTQESGKEYLSDATITSKVKTKLIADEKLKAFQIDVETFRGDVLLSGFVDSNQQAQHAVEIAKSVKGVKTVKDALVVKTETPGAPAEGASTRGGSSYR